MRNIAAVASGVDLKRSLGRGLQVAVAAIKAISRPVAGRKDWAQVATISARNDAVLGRQCVASELELSQARPID